MRKLAYLAIPVLVLLAPGYAAADLVTNKLAANGVSLNKLAANGVSLNRIAGNGVAEHLPIVLPALVGLTLADGTRLAVE